MVRLLLRFIRSSDRGQLIPVVGLCLVVLLGAAALAVDVGYWRYQQRLEQSAADSAAIAGASEINYPAAADIVTAAQKDAASNGFADGVDNTTVTVNRPPASGPNTGNNNAVEVIVKKSQPAFFAGIFGKGSQDVAARAVAALTPAGACIYVLKGQNTGTGNLSDTGQGGGIGTSPLCGLVVGGDLSTPTIPIDVSFLGYAGTLHPGGRFPHGRPSRSLPGTDPCPRQAGCSYLTALPTTHPELFAAPCLDTPALPASPLPPGHYCKAITKSVVLAPGLFILDKGPPVDGPPPVVSGRDVTIYNNCKVAPGTTCDTMITGGSSNDTLLAPATGPTAGMEYFQPPTLHNNIRVSGSTASPTVVGGVYAPSGTINYEGQMPTYSFLVAGELNIIGGNIAVGGAGFPGFTSAVLSE